MSFHKCQAKLTPKGIIHDFIGHVTGYEAAAELILNVLVHLNEACQLLRVNELVCKDIYQGLLIIGTEDGCGILPAGDVSKQCV